MNPDDRQRAVRGSLGTTYLLKLSPDLDERARAASKKEGISLAEWWRRAGELQLEKAGFKDFIAAADRAARKGGKRG